MTQLTITQARRSLLDLPERLRRVPGRAVSITRRGRPVLAVMPWEFYQSIIETLEVLSDPEMTAALRNSLEDLKQGRLFTHEEARKRLGV
ncbi:MAG: type II toxin-antitoxin system Phd/YefM family antitoxin [Candidatus Rokuibacteriota bacterium]